MFTPKSAFSGFSVDSTDKAREFYEEKLGLKVENGDAGIIIHLPGSGVVFCYPKGNDHQPASFTIMNFEVEDIDEAVDELQKRGIEFEHYPGMHSDEKGIARGLSNSMGPDIAWFKDPAGNILSVLQSE